MSEHVEVELIISLGKLVRGASPQDAEKGQCHSQPNGACIGLSYANLYVKQPCT